MILTPLKPEDRNGTCQPFRGASELIAASARVTLLPIG